MESTGSERHTYPVILDADWGSEQILRDDDALCLDATLHGNVARFINHRCFDANCILDHLPSACTQLAFFTTRKVNALEELTWDYGIDFFDENHPVKAFRQMWKSILPRHKSEGKKQRLLNDSWHIIAVYFL
ncbi:hypothetical protein ACLB2K_020985 [Fragaria x ananassa]